MSLALTEIKQADLFDLQEKVAETHELLKREKEFARRHQEMMEARHENAIRIGQNLCDFKATLPHGKFMTFVQAEFGISHTIANDYMLLAQNANCVTLHNLPLHAHVELASPSMPPIVIEMVETKQIAPTVAAIREAKREVLAQEAPSLHIVAPRNVDNIPIAVPHISSKNNEWYTPSKYVEAARKLMGTIDLDPASCAEANETVKAIAYYDISTNGLNKDWTGKVWLNPPYGFTDGESNQALWSRYLIKQYKSGLTIEAVLLVNAAVDTNWLHDLLAFPVCLTRGRINFTTPEPTVSGSTHGSAFVYFGPRPDKFFEIFSEFGTVVKRWQ